MLHYTTQQLATVIALPIVTILLVWTSAIYHKNKKRWGPYDIPIFALLILSVLRNLTILTYTLFVTLNQNTIDVDYCSTIVWIFNSIHTFQSSTLTTLAIIALFSARLNRKRQNLNMFLTSTHVIYHLFCLTTLCACVGVAAILAQPNNAASSDITYKNLTLFDPNPCRFMPFDLDVKFNVFIIVLNVFLASVSLLAFLATCYNHHRTRSGFDYAKKSTSDLSELSLSMNNNNGNNKNYYDTYTIQRANGGHFFQNGGMVWNVAQGDLSNLSTTVSSTNSRRPCLQYGGRGNVGGHDAGIQGGSMQGHRSEEEDVNRTGLETIHPVLIVCYLFYHLPIIVMCIYPNLVLPWPVAGVALWLGLVQDLLIPIGLSLVDTRFCRWVGNVYKCSTKTKESDKLPHVGLDGKFRPFTSQPQSLEFQQQQQQQQHQQQQQQQQQQNLLGNNGRLYQGGHSVEHRFPITNGSLYTSIDGRLPVIHNYRRKERGGQSSYAHPQIATTDSYASCRSCETDRCPSHSNLHHLSTRNIPRTSLCNAIQHQQLSLNDLHIPKTNFNSHQHHINDMEVIRNSRNLVRLNRMRLCKSEESLDDNLSRGQKELSDSEEDDYASIVAVNHDDTSSSRSSYSITTDANCDFEFYQSNNGKVTTKERLNSYKTTIDIKDPHEFRIKRSNSKRSLENFQAYVQTDNSYLPRVQRSNSFVEDRSAHFDKLQGVQRSNSKLSDCQRIKSVEYLPTGSSASTVFVDDILYFNYPASPRNHIISQRFNSSNCNNGKRYVGSVPDLKKVFISEYI